MSEEYPSYQQNPIPQQGQGSAQGQYQPQGQYPQGSYQQGPYPQGQPNPGAQRQYPQGQPNPGPQGQYQQGSYQPQGAYRQGYQGGQYAPAPGVIESASATTSPDNANSGYTAYILFGVVAIVLTLILMGVFGILRTAFAEMADEIVARGGDHPIAYDLEQGLEGYDEIINQLGLETVEG